MKRFFYKAVAALLLSSVFFTGQAQTAKVIKLHLFGQKIMPGNIIAPAEGSEDVVTYPPTAYTLYLEMGAASVPAVQAAWVNNVKYTLVPVAIPEKTITPGTYEQSGEKAIIKVSKNNYLFKAELEEAPANTRPPVAYRKNYAGRALLQLRLNGKTTYLVSQPLKMLEPVMMP